jgi:1-deoxy-D-xylulose-5-phosphate reductoisomerase
MEAATPAQARAHPNWDMGERISIDSASLFNKALEVIETRELFDIAPDRIEVVIHPQSVVHSMVGFADGSVIAQLGPSDMRGPIGFALNWPERRPLPVERLDFAAITRLDFAVADPERFPALGLARRSSRSAASPGRSSTPPRRSLSTGSSPARSAFLTWRC